ncbi:MAG TPA: hypothetical protein VGV93_00925, partial [Acidimicrobiales bacterium]|nr:hypothetical protein [Acidimicrobiales bacterium]
MRRFLIALLVCGLALAVGAAFSVALYTPPVGTWRPVRPEPGFVQQAYTGQPAVKDTGFYVSLLAAGPDGTLYVNQDRASRGAGDERPTRDAAEIVMLRPDGSAGVLEEPTVDGLEVEDADILAVGDDGTAYLHDEKNGRLVARAPDSTWRALTAAQHQTSRHDGDGGPALQAHIEPPGAAAVGPDGSVFVAEPFAVRRIAPDGIITTVAGTDAFDEGDVSSWGQGPPPRPALAQVRPGRAGALEAFELSKAASAEAELRPQRAPKPATDTVLPQLTGMNVLPDGSLVLVFRQNIRIVRPDGLMEVVAGPNEG